MTTPGDLQVWVMGLTGGNPVWDDTQWAVQNRLIPLDAEYVLDNQGAATFKLLRATRADSGTGGVITDGFLPTRGQYIAISDSTCTNPSTGGGTVYYSGVIQSWQFEKMYNSNEVIGVVQAVGLGQILDQIPLQNLHQIDSGGYPPGDPLLSHPTFNMEGQSQGQVIGNMVIGGDGNGQFSYDPTAAASLWDRWNILNSVCVYVGSTSALIPPLTVAAIDMAVQTMLQAAFQEILPTDGMTIKGLLDYLCGPSRGLAWTVDIGSSGWEIDIYSATDITVGSIPAASSVTANLDGTATSVRLHAGALDEYDGVEIRGALHVYCGTVSPIDGTLTSGWASAQESDYANPLSTLASPGNYFPDQLRAIASAIRASGTLSDVYCRFILPTISGWFWCKDTAGVPVSGTIQQLCPALSWSGSTLTVSGTGDSSPNPPEARLLPKLPWLTGIKANGTDLRLQEQQTRPGQIEPIVTTYKHPWVWVAADPTPILFTDLVHPPFSYWSETPSVSMDDRGPGIRIRYSIPHVLGLGHFTVGSSNLWDEYDPAVPVPGSAINPGSNWQNLVCTVAIHGDQPVLVTAYRAGASSTTARNILRVRRPDLQCWLVREHTIIGWTINSSGVFTPDEVPADTFVRNDYPIAQKLLDELSAYAFRKRTCATIILEGIQFPTWGVVGQMIDDLVEPDSSTTTTLSTMVTSLRFDFNPDRPRTIITTGDPALPMSQALAPTVPYFGGPVSVPMAGTTMGIAQRQETDKRTQAKHNINAKMAQPVPPAKSWPQFGTIRWAHDSSHGMYAECQLYNAAGTSLGNGAIGYIDIGKSILPTSFGDGAMYELAPVGMITFGGNTRRGFRAVRLATAGTVACYIDCAGFLGPYYWGNLLNSSGSSITTTIAGTASANDLQMQAPPAPGGYTPVGGIYLLPMPPIAAPGQAIVPLIMTESRGLNTAGGPMEKLDQFTIDYYCVFGGSGVSGAHDSYLIFGSITLLDTASATCYVVRHVCEMVLLHVDLFSGTTYEIKGTTAAGTSVGVGGQSSPVTIATDSLGNKLVLTGTTATANAKNGISVSGITWALTATPAANQNPFLSFQIRGGPCP